MKKQITFLILIVTGITANAQTSTFKAGVYYNADFVNHKAGKISYPSLELSYERALGKKFSVNLSFNYAKRDYVINYDNFGFPGQIAYGNYRFINYDRTLIPEGRFYPISNTKGLFIQLGIPITYTTEKAFYNGTAGEGTYNHSYFAMNAFGGLGLKYPVCHGFGIEMNMTISPSFDLFDLDYGTAGFIKSGIKLFYTTGKIKNRNLN